MRVRHQSIISGLRVDIEGDNFEKMLRKFKKKVENDGKLDTLDAKREYVKPSVKARLAKQRAIAKTKRENNPKLSVPKKIPKKVDKK